VAAAAAVNESDNHTINVNTRSWLGMLLWQSSLRCMLCVVLQLAPCVRLR
jgi:hypothetical protein